MFWGTLLAASVPVVVLFSQPHAYLFWQIIYAQGMAMALPHGWQFLPVM
jgi:hypothetical protein